MLTQSTYDLEHLALNLALSDAISRSRSAICRLFSHERLSYLAIRSEYACLLSSCWRASAMSFSSQVCFTFSSAAMLSAACRFASRSSIGGCRTSSASSRTRASCSLRRKSPNSSVARTSYRAATKSSNMSRRIPPSGSGCCISFNNAHLVILLESGLVERIERIWLVYDISLLQDLSLVNAPLLFCVPDFVSHNFHIINIT